MKFFVECDDQGTIKTIGSLSNKPVEEKMGMELLPRPGHKIVEVEVPEITDEKDYERIVSIKRKSRVEEHQGQYRLVSK